MTTETTTVVENTATTASTDFDYMSGTVGAATTATTQSTDFDYRSETDETDETDDYRSETDEFAEGMETPLSYDSDTDYSDFLPEENSNKRYNLIK